MTPLETTAARLEAPRQSNTPEIYRLLVRAGDQGVPVGRIQETLGILASTLSRHLKHLESINLVTRNKQGVTHNCMANYETMDTVLRFLTEECCADVVPE